MAKGDGKIFVQSTPHKRCVLAINLCVNEEQRETLEPLAAWSALASAVVNSPVKTYKYTIYMQPSINNN